jgi:hypothetical protein
VQGKAPPLRGLVETGLTPMTPGSEAHPGESFRAEVAVMREPMDWIKGER